ncbi:hypothetical protein [Vagococcus sp. WN89Y]|uniref:hypothetical protein n=1 Tax=Vagococcus sp. WN89Y TaxID=3457258 RepID=UPI003FCCEC82
MSENALMKTVLQKWFERLIPNGSLAVEVHEYDSGRHVAMMIPLGLLYGLDYHPAVWIYDEK